MRKKRAKIPARLHLALRISGILVTGIIIVAGANFLRSIEPVQLFMATYTGHSPLPEAAPVGIPGWMGWQHFLNMFFMVLLVRTGLQIRNEKRPPGYWKARKDSFFSPKGNEPRKVSLSQWLHQVLDVLWIANGIVFVVLLSLTGQWMRLVPTSWEIIPHALSAAVQYASLDWPTENGWAAYNALQQLAYFITIYLAAPLAMVSGWRMSTWWPTKARALNRVFPMGLGRALHFPVMIYFVLFTIVHVFLVFFTGMLRNLNHMYTSRDIVDAWGLCIFLASLAVITLGWFLIKPAFTTPLASRMGKVTRN